MQAPTFQERVVTVADTPVHYIEAGTGDPLLLIHGSLCDYRYWRWQMAALAQHFHVVAPSLPGCWPAAVGPEDDPERRYSVERHVRAVVELCEQLSPQQPVHLLGHSRGAQVAVEAALAEPARIGRLILADPGFPFTGEADAPPIHTRIAARLGTAALDDVLGEFVDTVNGPGTWRKTVSWFKEMVRDNAWTLVPQVRDMRRAVDADALTRALPGPVLLLSGEASPPRYGSRIEVLRRALPHAHYEVIARAAHGMNLANARDFNDVVLRFLTAPDS